MMMSSMPTSRNETKRHTADRFPEILLGICLVVGMSGCRTSEPASPIEAEEAVVIEVHEDYQQFYGHKVNAPCDTALYELSDEGFERCGYVTSDVIIDVEQGIGNMLHITDSSLYVNGDDVTASDRWYRNDTRLVPYEKCIVTETSYDLISESGQEVLHLSNSNQYPVYVLPGEDGRYGVRFMNAIWYIPETQVTQVIVTEGEPQNLAESIPVLMYHFFYSEEDGGKRVDGNYVEVKELEEQLAYISANDFNACTMRELQYWMEGRGQLPEGSIAITIDDADPSVHQYAMPLFVKYGLHATNFVICGWQPPTMPYELWEMRENGMELQSHGFLTHTGGCSGMGHGGLLQCMDHTEGVEDTIRSFEYVDGGFVYCYPFGDINSHAESILRDAGTKLAFSTQGGRITQSMDPLALPRVRVTGGEGLSAFAAKLS